LLLLSSHLLVRLTLILGFLRGREVGVAVGEADFACVDFSLERVVVFKPSQLFFANCLLFFPVFFLLGFVAGFCLGSLFVAFVLDLLPSLFLDFALFSVLLLSLLSLEDVLLGVR
jgi:hypothetical protein